MGRRRDRTFTGCSRCRNRKVKCDETKPTCLACKRIGATCPGYGPTLIWTDIDGHYQKSGDQRRLMRSIPAWTDYDVLSSDLVDLLLSQVDTGEEFSSRTELSSWGPPCHNPFSVFSHKVYEQSGDCRNPVIEADSLWPAEDMGSPPDVAEEAEMLQTVAPRMHDLLGFDDDQGKSLGNKTNLECAVLLQHPQPLKSFPDLSSGERMLFHHYVTHVAPIMMPYDHPRNPWMLDYPAAALSQVSASQRGLYNAILAQSAYNIAYLRAADKNTLRIGSEFYRRALQQLIPVLSNEGNDFSAMMASISTLMFCEVYSGESKNWRHHLEGAWNLLCESRSSKSWATNAFTRVSAQSVGIVRVISCTSETPSLRRARAGGACRSNYDEKVLQLLIQDNPDFGFTIGASPVILQCISRITEFDNRDQGTTVASHDFLEQILRCLNTYQQEQQQVVTSSLRSSRSPDTWTAFEDLDTLLMTQQARLQDDAFLSATFIYLYRTVLKVPPSSVKTYVSNTFDCVSKFFSTCKGNFSIWPAFIAAVEAYTDDDIENANIWLQGATSYGLGSRRSVKTVVEEVWRRRRDISTKSGLDLGSIAIDWRDVMHDLGCDVLLV